MDEPTYINVDAGKCYHVTDVCSIDAYIKVLAVNPPGPPVADVFGKIIKQSESGKIPFSHNIVSVYYGEKECRYEEIPEEEYNKRRTRFIL